MLTFLTDCCMTSLCCHYATASQPISSEKSIVWCNVISFLSWKTVGKKWITEVTQQSVKNVNVGGYGRTTINSTLLSIKYTKWNAMKKYLVLVNADFIWNTITVWKISFHKYKIFLHCIPLCVLDWQERWVDCSPPVDANVNIFDWLLSDFFVLPLSDGQQAYFKRKINCLM